MGIMDNSLLVWIVVAGIGMLVLRFILNVTKKVLTIGFIVLVVVAIYLFLTNYIAGSALF